MTNRDTQSVVTSTKAYYDGPADQIYRNIWGDNIHLGVPCDDKCPHPEAMEHTNEIMAQAVDIRSGQGFWTLDAAMVPQLVIWRRTTDAPSLPLISAKMSWNWLGIVLWRRASTD